MSDHAAPARPDLAELREAIAKAHKQPWKVACDYEWTSDEERAEDHPECDCRVVTSPDGLRIYDEGGHNHEDAALIVAAVNVLPLLLDRIEAADKVIEELTAIECGEKWCPKRIRLAELRALLSPSGSPEPPKPTDG